MVSAAPRSVVRKVELVFSLLLGVSRLKMVEMIYL